MPMLTASTSAAAPIGKTPASVRQHRRKRSEWGPDANSPRRGACPACRDGLLLFLAGATFLHQLVLEEELDTPPVEFYVAELINA
jgi:hypothetical protein